MITKDRQFLFTIFTPVYNGEKFIHRVIDSLQKLTYRNFEWIIVNDASTDNSDVIIRDFIESVDWDITYIKKCSNAGKHIAWNEAAQIAKGEIFITLDCDDACVPNALDFLNDKWNCYYDDISVYGIDTLCIDPANNQICGTKYPKDDLRTNYDELCNIYNVSGEKWNSFRTEYMRKFPFPEIKAHYYTECFLLYSLGEDYRVICFNEPLRLYYQEPLSLMHRRVVNINTLYMIVHYQRWHLRSMGFHLMKNNPQEFLRCFCELIRTWLKYLIMRLLRIYELQRY